MTVPGHEYPLLLLLWVGQRNLTIREGGEQRQTAWCPGVPTQTDLPRDSLQPLSEAPAPAPPVLVPSPGLSQLAC